MEKTWKPTAAGILLIFPVLISIVVTYINELVNPVHLPPPAPGSAVIYFFIFVIGLPVVIGAILAFRRSSWGLLLICSIFAWILYFYAGLGTPGILSRTDDWFRDNSYLFGILFSLVGPSTTALILFSKKEFK